MNMKFAGMAGLLAALTLLVGCDGRKPAGKPTSDTKRSTPMTIPTTVTAAQIKAMPHCKVTVEENSVCYSVFKTTDGQQFSIGGPSARQEVVQFLQTLTNGQTCEFPTVF